MARLVNNSRKSTCRSSPALKNLYNPTLTKRSMFIVKIVSRSKDSRN